MNKIFWTQRVNTYGHTGWSDNITYMYDQSLRLNLVEKMIQKYFSDKLKFSLDYGCGSGDFTKLLASYSVETTGVDIAQEIIDVAIQKNKQSNISFLQLDDLDNTTDKYSLVNAITVLQHILLDNELNHVLAKINKMLTPAGIFIIVDSYGDNTKSEYMKFRKYEDFLTLLSNNNFDILETYNLYHPQEKPTKLFTLYSNNIFVRILNKLRYTKQLDHVAKYISSFDCPIVISDTTTKLTIAKKRMS